MSDKDFPQTAEEARVDRDLTREELTRTLDALGHKLDAKARLGETVDRGIDQATARVATVSEPAAEKFRQGAVAVRRNPMPVFGGLLALVIVIRLLWRRRRS